MQVWAISERCLQSQPALWRGHQHARLAVAQDVAHLVGFEHRVERHKHHARSRGAKAGHHGFKALFKVDRHAVAARQAQRHQATGKSLGGAVQCGVGPMLVRLRERNGLGAALR